MWLISATLPWTAPRPASLCPITTTAAIAAETGSRSPWRRGPACLQRQTVVRAGVPPMSRAWGRGLRPSTFLYLDHISSPQEGVVSHRSGGTTRPPQLLPWVLLLVMGTRSGPGVSLPTWLSVLTSPLSGQHPAVLQGQAHPQERDPQAAGGSADRSVAGPRSGGSRLPLPRRSSASTPVTALGAVSPRTPNPLSAATPRHQQLGRSQYPRDR